MAMHLEPTGKV